jgi:hypothetical protein
MASKSDILRLLVLYENGGMYLDTDMILTQPDQLEWLIASSRDVDLALPYLWEHDDDVLFGLNTVSMLPYNNCVLAAPVKSPIIEKLLQTVEQSRPFVTNPFQWTLDTTGPVMIQKVIENNHTRVRLIPRALIQQAECVKPAHINTQGLQNLREKYPTAILVHGQDRSWFPRYWMTVVTDYLLSMCTWVKRRSSLTALVALILFCVLVVVLYRQKR